MSNKRRLLKLDSIYRKSRKKANLALILSNCLEKNYVEENYLEENSVATNSINIANNSDLHATASTSINTYSDTCNIQHNSSFSVCKNEFSNTSDAEIFDEVISNLNFILNDSSLSCIENYLHGNNSLNNNICITNNNIYNNSQPKNITLKIREWAMSHNIDHLAINNLLCALKPDHPELPLDARTLLRTPRQINVKLVEPGIYYHFVDKQTDNANHCTCCPIHKNYDEKFRRVFKELFMLRELTKESCEDIKVAVLRRENTDETESTFLSTFHFPLRCLEELNEVEEYLQEPNHFQSTVQELSKIGGSTPYDFIKRCLSLLLSNRLAEQYSWYGAKKKQVFGKLFLSNVLQESGLLCKAAENRKEIEEAIKTWLRRAKERADKEEKIR